MPVSAKTLGLLLDAGLTGDELRAVVASIDEDAAPKDTAAERRRAYDRERKRVHRNSGGQNADISTGLSAGIPPERHSLVRVENNLPTEEISGKKENKNLVDLDFEAAWRFYPHRKGRSSKPKALIAWKALPIADRQRMLPAVKRYSSEGYEPKADCGAKAFELWLRDQRYLDWMDSEIASVARGPPDPEAQRRYLDYLKEINPDVSAAQ